MIDDHLPRLAPGSFIFPDYLKAFLARLGHEVETYVPQLGTGEQRLI